MNDPILNSAQSRIRTFLQRHSDAALDEQGIHNVRVLTKQLRAYLKLYGECEGSEDLRKQLAGINTHLKQLADSYAQQRETSVQFKTLSKLIQRQPREKREQFQSLLDTLDKGTTPPDNAAPAPAPNQALNRILTLWPVTVVPDAQREKNLLAIYAKTKKWGKKAIRHNRDEHYHQWRKWVKYWLYCLEAFVPEHPDKGYQRNLKRLGTQLGSFHDLHLLAESLPQILPRTADPELEKLLNHLIQKRKKAYLKRFEKHYGELFGGTQKQLKKQLFG